MKYELPETNSALPDVVDRMERTAAALRVLSPIYQHTKMRYQDGYAATSDEVSVVDAYDHLQKAFDALHRQAEDMIRNYMVDFDAWRKATFTEAVTDAFYGTPRGGPIPQPPPPPVATTPRQTGEHPMAADDDIVANTDLASILFPEEQRA